MLHVRQALWLWLCVCVYFWTIAIGIAFAGVVDHGHAQEKSHSHGHDSVACSGGSASDPDSEQLLSSVLSDASISSGWEVSRFPQTLGGSGTSAWTVEDYPLPEGSTAGDYEPFRSYSQTVDTVVLVPIQSQNQSSGHGPHGHGHGHGHGSHGSSSSSSVGSVYGPLLADLITNRISAHFIVTADGLNVFKWISARYSSARLPCNGAGGEQGRLLVIAVETGGVGAEVSDAQIEVIHALVDLMSPSTAYNIEIKYLATLGEVSQHSAGGHGSHQSSSNSLSWCTQNGQIANGDKLRQKLCLTNPFAN